MLFNFYSLARIAHKELPLSTVWEWETRVRSAGNENKGPSCLKQFSNVLFSTLRIYTAKQWFASVDSAPFLRTVQLFAEI
jgi:hypothetical protein